MKKEREKLIVRLFKNMSLKYKLLLTVSIVVLALIAAITTQSINQLNTQEYGPRTRIEKCWFIDSHEPR